MNKLTCRECPYFWTNDDDEYPSCHFKSLGIWDPAPCEQDPADDPDKVHDLDVMDPVDTRRKVNIIVIHENGTITVHKSKNPVTFKKLQFHIGCDLINVLSSRLGLKLVLVVDDEARYKYRKVNVLATIISNFAHGYFITGSAVLCRLDGEVIRPLDKKNNDRSCCVPEKDRR